jgi:maltooligosyltrehalose trehalohydrolase
VAFDETDRWLVVRRGALRIAANLADRPRQVPLDAPVDAFLLASDAAAQPQQHSVDLPADSAAILRVQA